MPHRRYDDVEFNCFKTGGSVMTDIIHCLMCDDTYSEKQQVVTICPTCGNDDLSETVYVQNEEEV